MSLEKMQDYLEELNKDFRQIYRDKIGLETRTIIRKAFHLVVPPPPPPQPPEQPKPEDMWGRVFDMRKKVLVNLEGFSLYVMPEDYIGHCIVVSKNYEPHVTQLVRNIVKPGDVFMDVGANVGYFTFLGASLVGKTGKVIAFEPNPQNLHLIYSTALEFPELNIDIHPFAVSDSAQILKFITVGSNGGVFHDDVNVSDEPDKKEHNILVQSVVMDEILKNEPRIDVIKIDVEAHEPAALRGMKALLNKHRPKMITEFHPWALKINNKEPPMDYLHQLYELGYRLSIIETSGNILDVQNAEDIMSYWQALNSETIHLDLYAQP